MSEEKFIYVVVKDNLNYDSLPVNLAAFSGNLEGEKKANDFILNLEQSDKAKRLFSKHFHNLPRLAEIPFADPKPQMDPAIESAYRIGCLSKDKEYRKQNQTYFQEYKKNFKEGIHGDCAKRANSWRKEQRKIAYCALKKELENLIEKFFSKEFCENNDLDYEKILSLRNEILSIVKDNENVSINIFQSYEFECFYTLQKIKYMN